jgi:protein O-GlcNAc transferase
MSRVNPQQMLAQVAGLVDSGRLAEAEGMLRKLIEHAPRHGDLLNQTGLLCLQQGKFEEAEDLIRRAIAVNGSSAAYWANLGGAIQQLNRPSEAATAFGRAFELSPNDPRPLDYLAACLRSQGRVSEAVNWLRKSLALRPNAITHSHLLYTMWFDAGASANHIEEEHGRWAERWAKPLEKEIRAYPNSRDPERRLKVGYVSPDFRQHVIALFMQPILHHRDRGGFESICYADVSKIDFMTDRLKADCDRWVVTNGMSDAALAQRIREDGVDILVDLTAHMPRNRMLVFARKPAPVQVSYLAYAGTTGLPTMDYRFSDPHLDPAGAETLGPERVARLAETYWCYQPQIDVPAAAPRGGEGPVVFASFNTCAKINPAVIAAWSRILVQVGGSRLRLIVAGGKRGNEHLIRAFADHGVNPDRIELFEKINYADYFPMYNQVDIALDPFPYNGGTTTLDALFMGVPVVTLAGSSGMSRAGVSILTNAGLTDLIANTTAEYEQIAVRLAVDRARILQDLRARMQSSALMDAPRFVRNLESAYRGMWREYCGGSEAHATPIP